jgi:pantoate--beta-alanine ligase
VSIFVNPLQFGPSEDFQKYPRDIHRDMQLLLGSGAGMVFTPSSEEMYPAGAATSVVPGPAALRWEGAVRPGHFAGVLTVVNKLFNIVQPHVATFGRKDYQQSVLIRAMVRDLNIPVAVDVAPTVRDVDGLALSSRNAYLSADARGRARGIPCALAKVRSAWSRGERDVQALVSLASQALRDAGIDVIDYAAIVDPETLVPADAALEGTALLVAVRVDATRLIDNALLDGVPEPGLDEHWNP